MGQKRKPLKIVPTEIMLLQYYPDVNNIALSVISQMKLYSTGEPMIHKRARIVGLIIQTLYLTHSFGH